MATRDGATYFAGRVRGISAHYELGGIHLLTGHSVPNFELEDDATMGELLRAGPGILLDFGGDAALKTLAGAYAAQLKYISGRAKEQLGLRAVLIRPDGFVAWASGHEPAYSELQEAAARWFGNKAETQQ